MEASKFAIAFLLGALTTLAWSTQAHTGLEQAAVGTVTQVGKAAKRAVPSGKASIEILARGKNAFLGRLEMAGDGKVPEHRDPTEEYIHILEGTGTLYMEDEAHSVSPGTTIFMPAGAKVRFENGPKPLVALQVFAGPGPSAKYESWKVVR
jgi:quercetin dioxygenase-like cupin family protein